MNQTNAGQYKLSQFDYDLPQEMIAQQPVAPRDSSQLMILARDKEGVQHTVFREL